MTSCFLADGCGGVAFFQDRLATTPVMVMGTDAPGFSSSWSKSIASSSFPGRVATAAATAAAAAAAAAMPFFSFSKEQGAAGRGFAFFMEEDESGERRVDPPDAPPLLLLVVVVPPPPPPLLLQEKGRLLHGGGEGNWGEIGRRLRRGNGRRETGERRAQKGGESEREARRRGRFDLRFIGGDLGERVEDLSRPGLTPRSGPMDWDLRVPPIVAGPGRYGPLIHGPARRYLETGWTTQDMIFLPGGIRNHVFRAAAITASEAAPKRATRRRTRWRRSARAAMVAPLAEPHAPSATLTAASVPSLLKPSRQPVGDFPFLVPFHPPFSHVVALKEAWLGYPISGLAAIMVMRH
ncbi:hypothetical protein MUK42_10577 [Musa troglodytarum]|uniref:Uncharacterized protein n=1 Tax=Musa troglodytarum TaxID=320322 RepID=A0A9E7GR44_9LILI|nr:hypothetical protein MUK42_10577 [Musa troglodytarum]